MNIFICMFFFSSIYPLSTSLVQEEMPDANEGIIHIDGSYPNIGISKYQSKATQLRIYMGQIMWPNIIPSCLCSTIVVYGTSSFDETTITWNTRPATGKFLAEYTSVVSPGWYTWSSTALENYVDSIRNIGEDIIPFFIVIKDRNGGVCDVVWFFSTKEAGQPAQLIYNSSTYLATGDAWVTDGYPGGPDSNYGTDKEMLVCSCTLAYLPDGGYRSGTQIMYVQFSTSQGIEEESIEEEIKSMTSSFYPNPFSNSIFISYIIFNDNEKVRLEIYDIAGRQVKTLSNEIKSKGSYRVEWNGSNNTDKNLPNGIYFCRLKVGNSIATKKLILLR